MERLQNLVSRLDHPSFLKNRQLPVVSLVHQTKSGSNDRAMSFAQMMPEKANVASQILLIFFRLSSDNSPFLIFQKSYLPASDTNSGRPAGAVLESCRSPSQGPSQQHQQPEPTRHHLHQSDRSL